MGVGYLAIRAGLNRVRGNPTTTLKNVCLGGRERTIQQDGMRPFEPLLYVAAARRPDGRPARIAANQRAAAITY
jgi:hypothetical protein